MTGSLEETRVGDDGSSDGSSHAKPTQVPGGPRRDPPSSFLDKGALIGRYVVLGRLGSGAMGVVLAAYDPELDRRVALKLLKSRDHETDRKRLVREAQALARLNHPNVVGVHDVGLHGGHVFVAMELVRGQTLRQWVHADPQRSWSKVLAVLEAAGRGLVAAHAEGLVHRDFKPDNVMVGDDGRVRVMDFGLARVASPTDPPGELSRDDAGTSSPSSAERLDPRLTRVGAMLGTPAYMAPEQFLGGDAAPHSDQYSFCVTLYEALYGERPYAADSLQSLAAAAVDGQRRPPPRAARVPGWLRRTVLRGLSPRAADRFDSMESLLAAVGAADARRRRGRWGLGLAVVATAAAAAWGLSRYDRAQRLAACAQYGAGIDDVWGDEVRAEVRTELLATGVGYAPGTVERTLPVLDAFAGSWREHAAELCVQATVDETWDDTTYAKARWCLGDRRNAFRSLIERLRAPGDADVRGAVMQASSLLPAAPCADRQALLSVPPPPAPDVQARAQRVLEAVEDARALEQAGRYAEGLALVQRARTDAAALDWPFAAVHAMRTHAWILGRRGNDGQAEALATEAYLLAVRSDLWHQAAVIAVELIHLVGKTQSQPAKAKLWAQHAAAMIDRAGDHQEIQRGNRLNNLGNVHFYEGEYDLAHDSYQAALTEWESALGEEHLLLADPINNLGNVHVRRGEFTRARLRYERALDIRQAALGPDHPFVASSLTNLGVALTRQGRAEEAKAYYQRAIAILDRIDPMHPEVGMNLNNLAFVHRQQEQNVEAIALYRRSLTIKEAAHGPDHPSLAPTVVGLGLALVATGDHGASIPVLERALSFEDEAAGTEAAAELNLALADALWNAESEVARDRPRSHAIARRTARAQPADDDALAKQRSRAAAWLAEHPWPPPSQPRVAGQGARR